MKSRDDRARILRFPILLIIDYTSGGIKSKITREILLRACFWWRGFLSACRPPPLISYFAHRWLLFRRRAIWPGPSSCFYFCSFLPLFFAWRALPWLWRPAPPRRASTLSVRKNTPAARPHGARADARARGAAPGGKARKRANMRNKSKSPSLLCLFLLYRLYHLWCINTVARISSV